MDVLSHVAPIHVQMSCHSTPCAEALVTVLTFEMFDSSIVTGQLVGLQASLEIETQTALITGEGSLACLALILMSLQLVPPFELFATVTALKVQVVTVHSLVIQHGCLQGKPSATKITDKRFLPCMLSSMIVQLTLTGIFLFTKVTVPSHGLLQVNLLLV